MSFVHRQQVIHRDIKPSNLIHRRQDGRIVLIDFGAVKRVSTQSIDPGTDVTNLTIAIGTQGYMPNEQLAGKPRFSSDVYAVGMIGIRALTGVHPKRLDEDLRTSEIDWRKHAPEVSPQLAAILDCMVRYDFRDRYQTAIEALEALQSLPVEAGEAFPFPEALFNADNTEPEKEKNQPVDAVVSPPYGLKPSFLGNLRLETKPEIKLNPRPSIHDDPISISRMVSKTESTRFLHRSDSSQPLGNSTIRKFWADTGLFRPILETIPQTLTSDWRICSIRRHCCTN